MILIPKLVTTLSSYDRKQFTTDLLSGAVVGIVAIPLALAFAIASGVSPERGLFTAIIAGLVVSGLGGSRVQIGGPTGAFVVIVYDIVQRYGIDGLAACTILGGVILVGMGLARMGGMIKFIPYPVILGFTAGIAVVIFSSQVKDLLGLPTGSLPADFLGKWEVYGRTLPQLNWTATGLSAACLVFLWLWPKVSRLVPGPIVVLVLAAAAARLFGLSVETIGSRFGALPSMLPHPALPHIALSQLPQLVRPALTVALLAGIESLLSAVVSDGMIGGRHRSNMELIAQGIANILSPVFGGIPATGAIARTATNVKCGGRTPIAGMTHAAVVLLALFFAGRWIAMVPLCVLASILVVVSVHMSEWRSFRSLLRASRSDVAVLVTTFLLTVLVDLTIAVEVGMVLAAILFIRRMAEVTNIEEIRGELTDRPEKPVALKNVPPGVEVYRINGPFFFGAAGKLRETLSDIQRPPKAFILEMSRVPVMDATGLQALEDFQTRCRQRNTLLILSGLHSQPLHLLRRAQKLDAFDHVETSRSLDEALSKMHELLDKKR